MIPNLLQKSVHMCFRSIQIQLDSVRHPFLLFNGDVQRDNLQLKNVDLLLFFSESIEACADCASSLPSMTSSRSLVLFVFLWEHESLVHRMDSRSD